MANESSNNGTSSSASPPSPTSSSPSDGEEPLSQSPPTQSPPSPPNSPPPTPSSSPPPSPPPASPPPPTSPPPSKVVVPMSTSDESLPLPSSPSPPPPESSPPPLQSQTPSPPFFSPPIAAATTTPPSPGSEFTPPPVPTGSGPKQPSPPKPSGDSPESDSPSTSPDSGNRTGEIVGIALAGVFIIAFIALVIFFIIRKKKKRMDMYAVPPHKKGGGDVYYFENGQGGMHARSPSDPAQAMSTGQTVYSYEKIAEITNGFSSENIIGEGGFGHVYKASMPDGRVGALKTLKTGSGQGEREFRAEVDIISRVHHRHLVSLIGYCIAEQQRVLIYEYVPNGNLNQHLHGSEWPLLDWPKRMKIALGAARGLAYLHEGCNPKIIHRDIKSANILLDNAYEAQVADFGLARLTDDTSTHVSTRVMGTFGYMAPEYATSGKLTDRSDVFSFGVVLLELITGRKPVDPKQPIGEESLVEWARPLLLRAVETGDFGELVDTRLERNYVDSEMFRMIEAAAACVRHSAPKRPSMVQVARALDSSEQLCDLSNGVKYGQSTVYDSGQYHEDIMRFRRMANGSYGDSEFDMYNSTDYGSTVSREISSKHTKVP